MPSNDLDLLILIPGFYYLDDYQKLLYYYDIPVGTLQMVAFLKKTNNLEVEILDLRNEEETYPQLNQDVPDGDKFDKGLEKLIEDNQLISQGYTTIAINCYTSYQYKQTELIAKFFKKRYPNNPIIVGGYHPSAKPEDFNYKDSPYDYIIQGEAELPLKNFFDSRGFKPIIQERPYIISSKELVDINLLPFPDFALYLKRYPHPNRFKFSMYLSRGCPYQCAFCATNYTFRTVYQEKFYDDFNKLMKLTEKYNFNNPKISFSDQAFNCIPIRDKVLDFIIENHLNETFTFSCQSRVEAFSHNNIDLIKKFRSCNMIIGYGLESVNGILLKEMRKTSNRKNYIDAMKTIMEEYKKESGTYCRINILAGFPGEDHHTFMETVNFINDHGLHQNLQISPTLFSNYPNVHVYANMPYYRKKFGTEFLEEWWKFNSNSFINSIPIKPSKNYSLKDLLGDYKEEYLSILKEFKFNTFSELVAWKQFFNKIYKSLDC